MKSNEKTKEKKKQNRFEGLFEEFEKKVSSEDSLSGFNEMLDSLDDTKLVSSEIPFPYGGNSDFGKWGEKQRQTESSDWRRQALPF